MELKNNKMTEKQLAMRWIRNCAEKPKLKWIQSGKRICTYYFLPPIKLDEVSEKIQQWINDYHKEMLSWLLLRNYNDLANKLLLYIATNALIKVANAEPDKVLKLLKNQSVNKEKDIEVELK